MPNGLILVLPPLPPPKEVRPIEEPPENELPDETRLGEELPEDERPDEIRLDDVDLFILNSYVL